MTRDRLARWAPLVAGLSCLAVMVAVGLRLRRVHGAVGLDVRSARPVFARPFGIPLVPDRLADQFVKLGSPVPFALMVLALLSWALWRRDIAAAVTALLGPPFAVFAAEHLKAYFDRTETGADAYPSGHTSALAAIAMVVVVLAWRRWGPRSLFTTVPIALALSGGMVLTVVRIHSHVMSDALGGVLLGAGSVLSIATLASSWWPPAVRSDDASMVTTVPLIGPGGRTDR
ncbi:MAG: phosphoesterase [Acidimicrobiales bacterium]